MPTRRDVLMALVGAPFAAQWLACRSCDEGRARPITGSLLATNFSAGHRILRDAPMPTRTDATVDERVDVAVIGGGPAGLAAAWRLVRRGRDDVVVLELEGHPGGTSHFGESAVTQYPWAAHYLPVPMAHNAPLIELLSDMGALDGVAADGTPRGAEHVLVREPRERLYYRGFWTDGLYPYAGASARDVAQLHAFEGRMAELARATDEQGHRRFVLPMSFGTNDPDDLDELTAAAWMDAQGFDSPRLRWLVDYGCRDDYGLTLESTSAWAALFYHAARLPARAQGPMPLLTWPEGNGALVKHMLTAVQRRVRTGRIVHRVAQDDTGVTVDMFDLARERPVRLRARRVILAVPEFVVRRIVPGSTASDAPSYGAWIVANLHLATRPPEYRSEPAWDNVLYDSPSLGYVTATHQRGREHGPTVWTYYRPLTDRDPADSRAALLEARHDHLSDAIVADLARAHPELRAHVTRIDVFRWGHAMPQPRVGFLRRARARPRVLGRLHFAHTDLSGMALFEEAFDHAIRAADETSELG
jgi:phytoene dehydrogenase-like protein